LRFGASVLAKVKHRQTELPMGGSSASQSNYQRTTLEFLPQSQLQIWRRGLRGRSQGRTARHRPMTIAGSPARDRRRALSPARLVLKYLRLHGLLPDASRRPIRWSPVELTEIGLATLLATKKELGHRPLNSLVACLRASGVNKDSFTAPQT
jgi:hypothetical protein